MSRPILVTSAAGGSQGATGRHVAGHLFERGVPVRAFVHKLDARSDRLRELGAEVVQGDLLDPVSVRSALQGIKRANFTYPVADGLLEATSLRWPLARSQLTSWSTSRSFRIRRMRRAFAICSTGSPIASSARVMSA